MKLCLQSCAALATLPVNIAHNATEFLSSPAEKGYKHKHGFMKGCEKNAYLCRSHSLFFSLPFFFFFLLFLNIGVSSIL